MHRAVAQLVGEGLLTSRPGPGFPRSTVITLTISGQQRRAIALGILRDLERALGKRLGKSALAQLRADLQRTLPSGA
jgi:DNA-binding MarR family transcriptional regulator